LGKISQTGGLKAVEIITINHKNQTRSKTATFEWYGSLFYDKNNSLLMSMTQIIDSNYYRLNFNIFPGFIRVGDFTPGFFLEFRNENKKKNNITFGINFQFLPFGLAFGKDSRYF